MDKDNLLSIGTYTSEDLGFIVTKFTKNLTPDITENTQSIPGKIGLGYLQNSYGALEIQVNAAILADDAADMYATFRDISDALWNDSSKEDEVPITWSGDNKDGVITYWGHVTSVSTPTWVNEVDYRYATFTITFKCSTPYGFGATRYVRPITDHHGPFVELIDLKDTPTVNSDNMLFDTFVNADAPDITQRDFGSDDYCPYQKVIEWDCDSDTIQAQDYPLTLQLSLKVNVQKWSATPVVSLDSRSRNGEDVTGTAEKYSGSVDDTVNFETVVTYTDGTSEILRAQGTGKLLFSSNTIKGTLTVNKPIQQVGSVGLYINTFAERITIEDPQLQILHPHDTAHLKFDYRIGVQTPFQINLNKVTDTENKATTLAKINPIIFDINENGEFTGTFDSDVPLDTSGDFNSANLGLANDVETEVTIKNVSFTVTNADGTKSSLIASPESPETSTFIFVGELAPSLTLEPDGTGIARPLVSMKARDTHTKVGYEVQGTSNKYAYVGNDVSVTTGEITGNGTALHYENVLSDSCNDLTKWLGVGVGGLSWKLDGILSGRLASNGNGFNAAYVTYDIKDSLGKKTGKQGTRKNFGSAKNKNDFYGPVIKRYLTDALSDFKVTIRWSFHVNHNFAKGKEDFYLLDENGYRRALLQLYDGTNGGEVQARIILGGDSGSGGKYLCKTANKLKGGNKITHRYIKYYAGETHKVVKSKKVRYSDKQIANYKKKMAKLRAVTKPTYHNNKKTKAQRQAYYDRYKKQLAKYKTAQAQLRELEKLQKSGWKYEKKYNETVGTQRGKLVAESNGSSTYTNCYAVFTLQRIGVKYTWTVTTLNSQTHKQLSKISGTFTDKNKTYSNWNLSQVAYFMAKKNVSPYDDWSDKLNDTVGHYAEDFGALYDVKVDKITESVDPSPVVKKNDELVFNCEDHTVYKNSVKYMDRLSIGSAFTKLEPGKPLTIGFTPPLEDASWVIMYRPAYK